MILWNVILKGGIATSNPDHRFVSPDLHNLFLITDQINISSDMDDGDGDIKLVNETLHLFLKLVVLTLLWDEWNGSRGE